MRQLFATAFLAILVACTPSATETEELSLCADERLQFQDSVDRLEVLVDDWTRRHSAMKARVERGEAISQKEISEFEAARAAYANSLFAGERESSELLARIRTGCKG